LGRLDVAVCNAGGATGRLLRRPQHWSAMRALEAGGLAGDVHQSFREEHEDRPESSGPAAAVGELKIAGPDGGTLGADAVGELWVEPTGGSENI
jgi:hypothetical protein